MLLLLVVVQRTLCVVVSCALHNRPNGENERCADGKTQRRGRDIKNPFTNGLFIFFITFAIRKTKCKHTSNFMAFVCFQFSLILSVQWTTLFCSQLDLQKCLVSFATDTIVFGAQFHPYVLHNQQLSMLFYHWIIIRKLVHLNALPKVGLYSLGCAFFQLAIYLFIN